MGTNKSSKALGGLGPHSAKTPVSKPVEAKCVEGTCSEKMHLSETRLEKTHAEEHPRTLHEKLV